MDSVGVGRPRYGAAARGQAGRPRERLDKPGPLGYTGRMNRLILTGWLAAAVVAGAAEGWISMFDGRTLNGWRSNEETSNVFSVMDGALRVSGGRAHLFYVGPDGNASFTNFEFRCEVKTEPGANSGIYIHTAFQERGWPEKGYECQVNNTHKDPKKTGGLYAVADVMNTSPVADGEWFEYAVRVEGRRITISINGRVTTDWTEPENWTPPANMPGRRLSAGTIALQGHDPKSTIWYRNLRIRPLP